MKTLSVILALYWVVVFALFVTGNYTPNKVDIGVAFFVSSLSFISLALEAK